MACAPPFEVGRIFCAYNQSVSYYPRFYPDTVEAECHRYPYGRQPYIRITLEDGTVVDGKAHAWQGNRILANWEDESRVRKSLWMDRQHAVRIPYRESRWHDSTSADDIMWLAAQGEL